MLGASLVAQSRREETRAGEFTFKLSVHSTFDQISPSECSTEASGTTKVADGTTPLSSYPCPTILH